MCGCRGRDALCLIILILVSFLVLIIYLIPVLSISNSGLPEASGWVASHQSGLRPTSSCRSRQGTTPLHSPMRSQQRYNSIMLFHQQSRQASYLQHTCQAWCCKGLCCMYAASSESVGTVDGAARGKAL